jgi:hypothetical protein
LKNFFEPIVGILLRQDVSVYNVDAVLDAYEVVRSLLDRPRA